MFSPPPKLCKPGLFITGTDTGVGKTAITCAIALSLKRAGLAVGMSKPIASGCELVAGELVSDDAQALAHFAGGGLSLDVINPIRYAPPLAPAVASQLTDDPPAYDRLAHSLETLDRSCDALLIEGVGGLLVPLDDRHTVLDLIVALGYPVVVVTRAGLGTLNHTAMTVRLLRQAGARPAGLVVNGYSHDTAEQDASMATNPQWLERMNQTPVLATVPACPGDSVNPGLGSLPRAITEAVDQTDWTRYLAPPLMP